MDPITLVMGLANVVPGILKWMGHDNAAASATKILDIAQKVTGTSDGDAALEAIKSNPTLALQLQQELDRNKEALATLSNQVTLAEITADTANVAAINGTMQVEAKSDHWPTYSWRPFIGFCFGLMGLTIGSTIAVCYLGVMFFRLDAKVLSELPGMLGSMAAIMATMATPLGIASYFRGKAQADPAINNDMRG